MSRRRKGGTEFFLKERKKVEGEEIMKRRQVYGGSKNKQVGIAGSLRSPDLCPVPGQEVTSPRKGTQGLRQPGRFCAPTRPWSSHLGCIYLCLHSRIFPKGLSPGDPA